MAADAEGPATAAAPAALRSVLVSLSASSVVPAPRALALDLSPGIAQFLCPPSLMLY